MGLRFTKMQGAGNDFVMLDLRGGRQPPSHSVTAQLADRHFGVGADQIISIEDPVDPAAVASYRIWNADASVAGQCGNGARCVAAWVRREMGVGDTFVLQSPAGLHPVTIDAQGEITIAMGVPRFELDAIPLTGFAAVQDVYTAHIQDGLPEFEFTALSMGNPHAVSVVADVEDAAVDCMGPALQSSQLFPDSVNVGFAQVLTRDSIRLRVYERGAGETLACGSGACAAAAALMRRDLVDRAVDVQLPGGTLHIRWPADDQPITMRGPATFVFTGELSA